MPYKVFEVVWEGNTFRSKSEARVAFVLQALGVQFEYEPSCHSLQLGNGKECRYLPDFWLTSEQAWLEVKNMGSEAPKASECLRARLLAIQSGHPCYILFGAKLGLPNFIHGCCYKYTPDGEFSTCWCFTECPTCHQVGLTHRGSVSGLKCPCTPPAVDFANHRSTRILEAIRASTNHSFTILGW